MLAEPQRSNGGHRLYGEDAVVALRVIKAAQRLGFTLEEVAELLEAGRHRPGRPVAGLQDRAAAKLAEVDAKIADHRPRRGGPPCRTLLLTARTAAPKALGGLAALACVACCALPVLITAGVVGAGAGAVVGWLPALAVVLAVLAAGSWWLGQRHRSCSWTAKTAGEDGCGCKGSEDPLKIGDAGRQIV
ncbi:MerR family DNA-binding protein [Streptomyces sp. NPDC056580]|uniref:MerR family DNA-binding protein n=1 Tax=Streptomyces sp. NPDC056580 TaxID=3345872 RepID=UPI0036A64930